MTILCFPVFTMCMWNSQHQTWFVCYIFILFKNVILVNLFAIFLRPVAPHFSYFQCSILFSTKPQNKSWFCANHLKRHLQNAMHYYQLYHRSIEIVNNEKQFKVCFLFFHHWKVYSIPQGLRLKHVSGVGAEGVPHHVGIHRSVHTQHVRGRGPELRVSPLTFSVNVKEMKVDYIPPRYPAH